MYLSIHLHLALHGEQYLSVRAHDDRISANMITRTHHAPHLRLPILNLPLDALETDPRGAIDGQNPHILRNQPLSSGQGNPRLPLGQDKANTSLAEQPQPHLRPPPLLAQQLSHQAQTVVHAPRQAAEDEHVGRARELVVRARERLAKVGAVLVRVLGDGDGVGGVKGADVGREGVEVAVDGGGELVCWSGTIP